MAGVMLGACVHGLLEERKPANKTPRTAQRTEAAAPGRETLK